MNPNSWICLKQLTPTPNTNETKAHANRSRIPNAGSHVQQRPSSLEPMDHRPRLRARLGSTVEPLQHSNRAMAGSFQGHSDIRNTSLPRQRRSTDKLHNRHDGTGDGARLWSNHAMVYRLRTDWQGRGWKSEGGLLSGLQSNMKTSSQSMIGTKDCRIDHCRSMSERPKYSVHTCRLSSAYFPKNVNIRLSPMTLNRASATRFSNLARPKPFEAL